MAFTLDAQFLLEACWQANCVSFGWLDIAATYHYCTFPDPVARAGTVRRSVPKCVVLTYVCRHQFGILMQLFEALVPQPILVRDTYIRRPWCLFTKCDIRTEWPFSAHAPCQCLRADNLWYVDTYRWATARGM